MGREGVRREGKEGEGRRSGLPPPTHNFWLRHCQRIKAKYITNISCASHLLHTRRPSMEGGRPYYFTAAITKRAKIPFSRWPSAAMAAMDTTCISISSFIITSYRGYLLHPSNAANCGKLAVFVTWPISARHSALSCKNLLKSDDRLLSYVKKRFSRWQSSILKILIFGHVTFIRFNICSSTPNFIKIWRFFTEIWWFNDLQNGGRPPSWMFKIGSFCHMAFVGMPFC